MARKTQNDGSVWESTDENGVDWVHMELAENQDSLANNELEYGDEVDDDELQDDDISAQFTDDDGDDNAELLVAPTINFTEPAASQSAPANNGEYVMVSDDGDMLGPAPVINWSEVIAEAEKPNPQRAKRRAAVVNDEQADDDLLVAPSLFGG